MPKQRARLEGFDFMIGLLAALHRLGQRQFSLHRDTPGQLVGFELAVEASFYRLRDTVADDDILLAFRFVTHHLWGSAFAIRETVAFLESIGLVRVHEPRSTTRRWLEVTGRILEARKPNLLPESVYDKLATSFVLDLRRLLTERLRQPAPA